MGSTGQCEIHGRKRVKFGNKLVNVQFSVNSFKISVWSGTVRIIAYQKFPDLLCRCSSFIPSL